jgi:hypothetical protein
LYNFALSTASPEVSTLPAWVSRATGTALSEATEADTSVLESVNQAYMLELKEGFRTFGAAETTVNEPVQQWADGDFSHFAVGIGTAGPDESVLTNGNVIFQTIQPVLSKEECDSLIAEAQQVIQDGLHAESLYNTASGTEPTNSQLGEARVSQLPIARQWLQTVLHTRLFPLLSSRFGIAAADLTLQDGLIIGYGHPNRLGSRAQPIHRDSCLVSLNIALSPRTDYTDGGTFFEAVSGDLPEGVLFTEQGHATCHAGGLAHAGRGIGPDGERWVLVLFVIGRQVPEYARRCHAQGMATPSAAEPLLAQGLLLAPRDHLLWTSLGRTRMEQGNATAADLCLALAAQSYAHCRQADLALGQRFLSRRRPRAALRRFDRVRAWLDQRDEKVWWAYRAMGWDARYYGAQAGLLCAREVQQRGGDGQPFVKDAMARCQEMLQVVPDDHRILGMISFAEDLLKESSSKLVIDKAS